MAVFGLISTYFPSPRLRPGTEFKGASLWILSIATDMDILLDWLFYFEISQDDSIPRKLKLVQFVFCLLGVFTWLLFVSTGRLLLWFPGNSPIVTYWSSGFLLALGVLLEDTPQIILTFIIELYYRDEEKGSCLSGYAVANILTAVYDFAIKIAEAYERRGDLIEVSSSSIVVKTIAMDRPGYVTKAARIDDARFVVAGEGNTFTLWDYEEEACLRTFVGHDDWVWAFLRFHDVESDKTRLLSGSHDKTVRMWDLESGSCMKVFRGGHGEIVTAISALGQEHFLVASGGNVHKWKYGLDTGEQETFPVYVGGEDWITAMSTTVDEKFFIVGTYEGHVSMYCAETGNEAFVVRCAHNSEVKSIITFDDVFVSFSAKPMFLRIGEMKTGNVVTLKEMPFLPTRFGNPTSCSLCKVNTTTFLAAGSTSMCLMDLQGDILREISTSHTGNISDIVRLRDEVFLTGSRAQDCRFWRID